MTKRRNHSPSFKAKVALTAARGDNTLAELSQQFGLHQTQIHQWRQQLMEQASSLFERSSVSKSDVKQIEQLHSKIGQLTMECDFLERGLDRIQAPYARR